MNTKTTKTAVATAIAATVGVTVEGKEIQVPTDETMRSEGMDTLSARIRHLNSLGVSKGDISRIVKRSNGAHPLYQHVRNVLNTPLKASTPAVAVKEPKGESA